MRDWIIQIVRTLLCHSTLLKDRRGNPFPQDPHQHLRPVFGTQLGNSTTSRTAVKWSPLRYDQTSVRAIHGECFNVFINSSNMLKILTGKTNDCMDRVYGQTMLHKAYQISPKPMR